MAYSVCAVDTPYNESNHMSGYIFSNTSLSSKCGCLIVLTSIFLDNEYLRASFDPEILNHG